MSGEESDLRRRVTELERELADRSRQIADLENFRLIAEWWTYGVAMAKPDGTLLYVNPSWARVHGYTPDELVGRHLNIFHSEAQRPGVAEINARAFATGGYRMLTVGHVHRDGTEFPMLMSGIVVPDEDGRPKLIAATAVDARTAENAEEEEKRLRERLLQAQKMEAIGLLASGVAHDFNNILTAILGQASVLTLDSPLGSEVHEAAREIERASGRAARLTRQLLSFAHRGKQPTTAIDLADVVREVVRTAERCKGDRLLVTQKHFGSSSVVMGDSGQLSQMVAHLVTNACEAMREGGRLTIETDRIETMPPELRRLGRDGGPYLQLTVADTGSGIDPARLERIFEPFFTTKEAGKGAGMGLAMVYGIVKSHGGQVTVASEIGKGSCFRIYLPLVTSGETDRGLGVGRSADRSRGLVLLVDDEEVVQTTGARMLERLGYEVVVARNGQEAVEIFRDRHHEVVAVLLDIVMPVMDGFACFEALRGIDPKVKVVVSTGCIREQMAKKLLTRGAVGLASKPYSVTDLARILDGVLGR